MPFFISFLSDLIKQVHCKGYNQKRQRKAITCLIDAMGDWINKTPTYLYHQWYLLISCVIVNIMHIRLCKCVYAGIILLAFC